MFKQFGGKVNTELVKRYAQSPNWYNGLFQNLEETSMNFSLVNVPRLLYRQLTERNGRYPSNPLPILPIDINRFLADSLETKMIWYGHSTILMRMNQKTLLIDPMLNTDAAPTAPFKIKRFSEQTLSIIDHLPPIDLVLLTHDHYDHLDLASIQKLKSKAKHYFVALGVARHLIEWGINPEQITEFDWWQQQDYNNISITFTPSRHFSGRGLKDRFTSLWGGWTFRNDKENIYFSGDGGYGNHFKEVGKRLGPFTIGMMECGQYNEHWHQIHMFPEESVQAAIDAGVNKVMAIHWGAFALALHSWKDPIQRFAKEASLKNLKHISPQLGEVFHSGQDKSHPWWDAMI